jgi:hypothetical protein
MLFIVANVRLAQLDGKKVGVITAASVCGPVLSHVESNEVGPIGGTSILKKFFVSQHGVSTQHSRKLPHSSVAETQSGT